MNAKLTIPWTDHEHADPVTDIQQMVSSLRAYGVEPETVSMDLAMATNLFACKSWTSRENLSRVPELLSERFKRETGVYLVVDIDMPPERLLVR